MPNKSRTQTVNKGAGKMRYTGYQVDKDGTEWVSQRDSANREWLTNQKTGETELSKASQEVAAARALAMMRQGEKAPRSPQQYMIPPVPQEGGPDSTLGGMSGMSTGNSMVAPSNFNFNKSLRESSPQKKAAGGAIKKYARGGGIEQRGKTRGKFV